MVVPVAAFLVFVPPPALVAVLLGLLVVDLVVALVVAVAVRLVAAGAGAVTMMGESDR